MARAVWALLVGMAMWAAGCTTVTGQPTPATPAAPAGPTVIALPPRPLDVRLDGVDPCSLLTEAQRIERGLDGHPVYDEAPSDLYEGEVASCVISGYRPRAVVVALSLVTTVGIERFTSGDVAADVRAVTVRGFPAVVVTPTRFTDYCTVAVDVAPGQLLDVQFADGGREPPIPQPQLCRDAESVANAVMATLLAR